MNIKTPTRRHPLMATPRHPRTEARRHPPRTTRRLALGALAAALAGLAVPALALAHARVSPPISLSGKLQLYSLAVPTEKAGLSTTKLVMTVPSGFGIDSFVPPPAPWRMQVAQSGSGDNAVITQVTFTGGRTATGEDSLFQFLAQPASAKTYTFHVQQTYSDGSIVDWSGPESSASPAPTIETSTSLGGGGSSSVIAIIALIIAAVALVVGGFAVLGGSRGRALA